MLDEISDNDIEDIEDDKKESEDETMDADDEDLDEYDGEITEEQLAEIKVNDCAIFVTFIILLTFFFQLFSVKK